MCRRIEGTLWILSTAAMFGVGAALAKVVLGYFGPAIVLALDLVIGFGFLAIILFGSGRALLVRIDRDDLLNLVAAGIGGTALPVLSILAGLQRTTATKAGLLLQQQSLAAIVFSLVLLGERLGMRQWLGATLLAAGGVLVVIAGETSGTALAWNTGDLLVLLGAWGLGLGLIPAKRLVEVMDPDRVAALRLLMGIPVALPLLLFPSLARVGTPPTHIYVVLAIYCVTNFGVAYVALHRGLRLLGTAESGSLLLTTPLFAAFAGVLILDETVTLMTGIGGLATLIGAWAVSSS